MWDIFEIFHSYPFPAEIDDDICCSSIVKKDDGSQRLESHYTVYNHQTPTAWDRSLSLSLELGTSYFFTRCSAHLLRLNHKVQHLWAAS